MKTQEPNLLVACCALGVLLSMIVLSQDAGLSQSGGGGQAREVTREDNPNYPPRNPFYFEGKIDYELLGIDEPADAWEFMQRGIHKQDDLEDYEAAIQDYRRALDLNSLANDTCQLVDQRTANFGELDPPPCIFTLRLRLGYLLIHDDPEESIRLFKEVLEIDPLRLEVNFLIAEAYEIAAEQAATEAEKEELYEKAIEAAQAELALTPPVNDPSLSPDEANNAHTHWLLAEVYEKQERYAEAIGAFQDYLKATRWHSDVLPWRIPLAEKKIEELAQAKLAQNPAGRATHRGRVR